MGEKTDRIAQVDKLSKLLGNGWAKALGGGGGLMVVVGIIYTMGSGYIADRDAFEKTISEQLSTLTITVETQTKELAESKKASLALEEAAAKDRKDLRANLDAARVELIRREAMIERNTENNEKLWPIVRANQQLIRADQAATQAELKALSKNIDRILNRIDKE